MIKTTSRLIGCTAILLSGFLLLVSVSCRADEALVTTATTASGDAVPYVLNTASGSSPRYVLILFPGGMGLVDPHLEDGKLAYSAGSNFLLRARPFLVDDEFATVATNATSIAERVQALLDDLHRRFPEARIYVVGTSRGTLDTMALADYLSDRVAGEIHTSSMQRIAYFDARKYHNRQLIVHHRDDSCRNTPITAAQRAHDQYGDELFLMDGGISEGDACGPFAHHGYNGIEKEAAEAIKQWVKQGG